MAIPALRGMALCMIAVNIADSGFYFSLFRAAGRGLR
jgi:hypothetical protein